MDRKLRTFIAIPVPKIFSDECLKFFPKKLGIPPSQWHITLSFLGICEWNKIHLIQQQLKDILENFTSFRIYSKDLQIFNGRCLVLTFQPSQPLFDLITAMDTILVSYQLHRDHPFIPHLTLARFPHRVDPDLHLPVIDPIPLFVHELIWFESVLNAPYSMLYRFLLKQSHN